MSEKVLLVHSTTVALAGRGVMLRGPSGSGKSELALRLMEQMGTGLGRVNLKANLVADDQTEVFERKTRLWVRCPRTISGQMEMRGLGIFTVKPAKSCPLALVVDLCPAATIERMPEPEDLLTTFLGHQVPRIMLDAGQPAAASILRLAFVQMC
jgi:serine kinase of HPr protein (carbohydrate metabolism regulator)